jgi:hypothetical protein
MPNPFMYLVVAELTQPGPTSFIASLEGAAETHRFALFPLHAEGAGKKVSILQLPNWKGEFGR